MSDRFGEGRPMGEASGHGSDDMGNGHRDPRDSYRTMSILADGVEVSNDTWQTGLNDNLLVLGSSGSGKTRHVLKPNLLQMNASYVVLDTKGTLHREVGPFLEEHGYKVMNLDFTDLGGSDLVGYNPLDFVGFDEGTGEWDERDILAIADALCPVENGKDPFWDFAAADYFVAFMAYVLEACPASEHSLDTVLRLIEKVGSGESIDLMRRNAVAHPRSIAARHFSRIATSDGADKMQASIFGIMAEKVRALGFRQAIAMYRNPDKIDFAELGRRRCALFVTISDVDRSLVNLTDLFVYQCLTQLMRAADASAGSRLAQPVRLFLDDFGNLRIKDFDQFISVARSREIWVTVLCQTVSQLCQTYDRFGANSIIGNCDYQLVLGFQDEETARYFSPKAGCSMSDLLATPIDRSWLFVRGQKGRRVRRYDVESHPRYAECLAAEALHEWDAANPWGSPEEGEPLTR